MKVHNLTRVLATREDLEVGSAAVVQSRGSVEALNLHWLVSVSEALALAIGYKYLKAFGSLDTDVFIPLTVFGTLPATIDTYRTFTSVNGDTATSKLYIGNVEVDFEGFIMSQIRDDVNSWSPSLATPIAAICAIPGSPNEVWVTTSTGRYLHKVGNSPQYHQISIATDTGNSQFTSVGNITGVYVQRSGSLVYHTDSNSIRQTSFAGAGNFNLPLSTSFTNFSTSTQTTSIVDLAVSMTGDYFYVLSSSDRRIYVYTASTAFLVSTLSYTTFLGLTAWTAVDNMAFSDKGDKFYLLADGKLREYTMSTLWDISTATYTGLDFAIASATIIGFSANGVKLLASDGTDIWQYNTNKLSFKE